MPKVEPEFIEECESGRRVVPLSDLDRANAEIERITRQRDALAVALAQEAEETNTLDRIRRITGLIVHPDGTVTEIGHG